MFAIVINKENYKVEFVALDQYGNPQFYELKEGESLIKQDYQLANSMNKPQWNGIEWIETEIIQINLEELKSVFLTQLESYKHDHIQFLQYDGHTQRYLESDRLEMLDAQESLEKGLMPSIEWKYGFDEIVTYVVVTDPLYFVNMRLNGGAAKQKAFAVEKILTEEINALTEEQLQVYDLKARFDEVFKTLT